MAEIQVVARETPTITIVTESVQNPKRTSINDAVQPDPNNLTVILPGGVNEGDESEEKSGSSTPSSTGPNGQTSLFVEGPALAHFGTAFETLAQQHQQGSLKGGMMMMETQGMTSARSSQQGTNLNSLIPRTKPKKEGVINAGPVGNNLHEMSLAIVNRAEVSFKLDVFFLEFIYNLLFPLSLPLCLALEGRKAAYQRGFWGCQRTFFIQLVLAAAVATMNVMYFGGWTSNVYLAEILLADASFFVRCCVISIKYGYFPVSTLRDLRESADTDHFLRHQIITGWRIPDSLTIQQEINYSIVRNRSDISSVSFSFEDRDFLSARFKEALEDKVLAQHPNFSKWKDRVTQRGQVHARVLLTQIHKDSIDAVRKTFLGRHAVKLSIFMALVHMLLPSIVRSGKGQPFFGNNDFDYTVIAFTWWVTFFNFFANFTFLLVGVLDFKRRLFVMHDFSDMLSERIKGFKLQKNTLPTINYQCPFNMGLWWEVRVLAKDHGRQFYWRIQLYSSVFFLSTLALLAFLIYQLVVGTAETATIVLIDFDVLALLFLFIFLISMGKDINRQALEHRSLVLKKQAAIQTLIALSSYKACSRASIDPTTLGALQAVVQIAQVMIKVMEVDHEENPLRILGFHANENFNRALLTICLSFFGIALRLFLI